MVKPDFAAGTVRGKTSQPRVARHAPVERVRVSDEPQTMPLEILEEVQ